MPAEAECRGLLALILFTHARSAARVDEAGNAVLLRDQKRTLWNAAALEEGRKHLGEAMRLGGAGPFVLRAALSREHALAASASATRWDRIVELYDGLLELEPSPLIALNRAVAVGEVQGAAAMLADLEQLVGLDGLHYFHVARGDALSRLDRHDEAEASFVRALSLCRNDVESNSIRARLRPSSAGHRGA